MKLVTHERAMETYIYHIRSYFVFLCLKYYGFITCIHTPKFQVILVKYNERVEVFRNSFSAGELN